jgi:amino acid transporter
MFIAFTIDRAKSRYIFLFRRATRLMFLCRKCGRPINLHIENFCTNCGFVINPIHYPLRLKDPGYKNPLRLANKKYDNSEISGLFYFIAFISFIVMISIFIGNYYFHIFSNPIVIVIMIIAIITLFISAFIAGISDPNQDDYVY